MSFLFKLLAMLPLRVLQLLGAGIGYLTFKFASELRERTYENLRQAGFTQPHFLDRLGRGAGRQSLESIWVWYRDPATVLSRVEVDPASEALIDQVMDTGRPIIFMTPHVGCFEVLPVWFANKYFEKTGRNISILYRPPKNAILRKIVGEARQSPGIEACPTTIVGVKRVIKNLRQGHTFGVLPDQVPSAGDGVWVPFFGKEAYTMILPVRLAKQVDAIRIFAWAKRESHGWTLHAKEWLDPLTGDLEQDATMMNKEIEDIIRQMPEQYAWGYNRYKTPSGARPKKKKS